MNKNTICLWYTNNAEEAARFYAKTFPNSNSVHRAPSDYPGGGNLPRAKHFQKPLRWNRNEQGRELLIQQGGEKGWNS